MSSVLATTVDGIDVYNGPGEAHVDTGPASGTTYYYTAFTYDFLNYSSGASVSGTTS